MEELQSTDILDHEILEDARKKAMRILKTADETIHTQTKEWEQKKAGSNAELEKKYNEHKTEEAERVMARLPIDKLRIKIEKIETLLQSAVDAWYRSLSRSQIAEFLKNELSKRLSLCVFPPAGEIRALYSSLELRDAQEAVKAVKGSFYFDEVPSASHYPSITLETGDMRIIASFQKEIDYFLQEKREELVEALVGRELKEGLA